MAFYKSLDETIKSETIEFEKTKLVVSIMSYNKGQQKVQISRLNKTEDDKEVFSKLGRLTKEEVGKLVTTLGEIFAQMSD